MKRTLMATFVIILVFGSILVVGCANNEAPQYQVDRTITGQVIAIDNNGYYSTLYFGNGLEISVTSATLSQYRIDNMFVNVWTYKFRHESYDGTFYLSEYYDLIGINDEFSEEYNQPE